jgi:hypothetical protein
VLVAVSVAALVGCGGGSASAPQGATTGSAGAGVAGAAGQGEAGEHGSAGTGGNSEAGTNGGQAGAAGGQAGAATGWGEATVGPTVGPFVDVKLFRAGCGQQLWGRWINGSTVTLKEATVTPPSGNAITTTYLEEITFTAGKKSIFLLNDGATFGPGAYEVALQVSGADGTHTHTIHVDADEGLFLWPGRITLDGVAHAPSGGYRLDINPTFDGSVVRAILYSNDPGPDFGCVVSKTVFLTPFDLQNGTSTELDLGSSNSTSGRHLLALLQGSEPAANWTFYSTFELTTP